MVLERGGETKACVITSQGKGGFSLHSKPQKGRLGVFEGIYGVLEV